MTNTWTEVTANGVLIDDTAVNSTVLKRVSGADFIYQFYLSSNDLAYKKSKDGGVTWGFETVVAASATYGTLVAFDIWYGKWTPNDTTDDNIYIVTAETTGDDLDYFGIDTDESVGSTGLVTLTGGASGSVDGIFLSGVESMSGAESFDTDLDTTATNVAANITAHTSSPNFTATATGSVITITALTTGDDNNGHVVTPSFTTITGTSKSLNR